MRATYRVRVRRPAAPGGPQQETTESRDVEADNVAIMGPFIVFQQVKPLRAVAGQPPPLAAVYAVSAESLIDVEELTAELDRAQVPEPGSDYSIESSRGA